MKVACTAPGSWQSAPGGNAAEAASPSVEAAHRSPTRNPLIGAQTRGPQPL